MIRMTMLALLIGLSGCAALEKKGGVEYAAGNTHPDAIAAQRTPSTGSLESSPTNPVSGAPTPPTEQSATDSQSAMSQSAADLEQTQPQEVASETHPIPATKNPEGEVEVKALGLTELRIRGNDDERVPALHLQMTLKNLKSRSDWNVDSRLQQIRFSGSGEQLRPLFVQAESQTLPFIKVQSGKTLEVDLFYALPRSISRENAPSFELSWTILASDESISRVTTFKRLYPESRKANSYPFEQSDEAAKPDPASKGTPMLREWWQDPYGYATPGSPVFNSYQ